MGASSETKNQGRVRVSLTVSRFEKTKRVAVSKNTEDATADETTAENTTAEDTTAEDATSEEESDTQ